MIPDHSECCPTIGFPTGPVRCAAHAPGPTLTELGAERDRTWRALDAATAAYNRAAIAYQHAYEERIHP